MQKPPPEYSPVPERAAKHIAEVYQKSIVVILAYDPAHDRIDETHYGINAKDKIAAEEISRIVLRRLTNRTLKAA